MREARFVAFVWHVREKAVRVRIRERPMLAPAFDVVAALHEVEAALFAPIRAGEQSSFAVDFNRERVPTTFGEQFELLCARMISPNRLTKKSDAANSRCTGATLRAIKPAVRSPSETICDGVRVLQSEA